MLGSSGLGGGGRRTNPRFFFAGLMLLLPFCACGSDGDSSPSVSSTDSAKPTPTPAFTETSSTLPPEDDVAGDLAVWKVAAADSLSAESESFTAYVTRLGCSGGVTGEVYAPVIVIGDRDIVVTFSVAPLDLDVRPCISNEEVPFVVDIGEPIGERRLVDGACLDDGEASSTGFCRSGPERWSP
jgi:hypothetical protein